MAISAVVIPAMVMISSLSIVEASSFLRPHVEVESEDAARIRVVEALLAELSKSEDSASLRELQEQLRPLYTALPKDAEGKLEPPTLRYALHRHFAQWRGWHMKGLEHGASETNTTAVSVAEIFGRTQGIDLAKFTLLVSKLTSLVHHEVELSLRNVYSAMQLPLDESISKKDADLALRWFLVMYLLGDSTENCSRESLLQAERDIVDLYAAWRGARMWFRDLGQTLQFTERTRRNPFVDGVRFGQSLGIAQELGHRFASFQNLECKSLKNALMDIEHQGTGRVLLSDFYRVGLTEDWQFNENVQYLRSLGALDEGELSIFIPNYLHSPTNCLSASDFYSVCCFNECEGLMAHLENSITAPSAPPSQLLELVARMESDTVAAPRNLSSALEARIFSIAKLHGGQVPLHGRLFAQWMHHAYPRECPFPHLSGSTLALSQEEWQRRMGGEDPLATKEEMQRRSAATEAAEHQLASLPWTEVEELVAPSQQAMLMPSLVSLRWAAALALLMSIACPLLHAARSQSGLGVEDKTQRYLV